MFTDTTVVIVFAIDRRKSDGGDRVVLEGGGCIGDANATVDVGGRWGLTTFFGRSAEVGFKFDLRFFFVAVAVGFPAPGTVVDEGVEEEVWGTMEEEDK